jgi:hypothetical protein
MILYMRHGNFLRQRTRALMFHLDCVAETKAKTLLSRLVPDRLNIKGPLSSRTVERAARNASVRIIEKTDYSLLVAVTDKLAYAKSPQWFTDWLELENGFLVTRVILFPHEHELRAFLTDPYVEIYYDTDAERVFRVGQCARVFKGWDKIGY